MSSTKRSGWKVFLTPGWVITTVLVIAFSYLAFTVLSPWQLGKDRDIVNRNEHVDAAFEQEPTDYHNIFDDQGEITNDQEWRRVRITGHYLPDKEVLLRMRPVESGPSYQSLVPFQIDDGPVVLINRGFEPTNAGDAPHIPTPPSGNVTLVAHARANERTPDKAPMQADGYQQVYGINTQQIGKLNNTTLGRDYLQLSSDEPGVLQPIPIPKQDRGNHLSYGFQWIAFGIMAPLGLGYFVYSEIRERKRVREEEAALAASQRPEGGDGAQAPASKIAESPAASAEKADPPAQAGSTPQRSRYGSKHPAAGQQRGFDRRRDNF
ncbi:SURF1 family protein [Corynebacterium pelargi]|uniref:SURF1-like protein n=1 Tax=Corynebacterium pelargi TaxID=1471400 RepID=A0A410W7L6_9CORY|nr:SURF1 family protein [Corynebacterium pelargi]QAU51938.1 SURF1 family protein [Corynebacterium pelargi]GGG71314.1 SURF1-like protein [Corynebacterium pelargi]